MGGQMMAQAQATSNLVAKNQFAGIKKGMAYKDLVALYGKAQITEDVESGAEGEGEIKITVVFKDTPKEMIVYWAEKKWHTQIVSVACRQTKSPYQTADSLHVGSDLNALVKANKAAIAFYGFGWDYGGTITNYYKGKLTNSTVRFFIDWDGKNDDTLLGEGEFNSNMPKVKSRAAKIKVARIESNFE